MTYPTTIYDIACDRCGHRSALSVANNGTNHVVGLAVHCMVCPPQRGKRIGFGLWNRLKSVGPRKKGV